MRQMIFDKTHEQLLRELAKAINIEVVGYSPKSGLRVWNENHTSAYKWDPLRDDGDAFRLAVKYLQFHTLSYTSDDYEACDENGLAATRYAIVRIVISKGLKHD